MINKKKYCLKSNPRDATTSGLVHDLNNVHTESLKNGATLIGSQCDGYDSEIVLAFPYGLLEDQYLPHFWEHLVFRSRVRGSRDPADVAIEKIDGAFDGYCSNDVLVLKLKVLESNLPDAFQVLTSVITNPNFDEKDLENERRIILGELLAKRSTPCYIFDRIINNKMAKINGMMVNRETRGGIRAVTLDDLLEAKLKFMGGKGLVVSVVSPNVKTALKYVRDSIVELPKVGCKPRCFKLPDYSGFIETFVRRDYEDSPISFTAFVPGQGHSDLTATQIASNILSGEYAGYSSRSRLWKKLRQELGMLYSPDADYYTYPGAAFFQVTINGISPSIESEVRSRVLREFEKLGKYPISHTECEAAKRSMVMEYIRQTPASLAEYFALIAINGGMTSPIEYLKTLDSVDAGMVRDVAKKYLAPERLSVVTIKPA